MLNQRFDFNHTKVLIAWLKIIVGLQNVLKIHSISGEGSHSNHSSKKEII